MASTMPMRIRLDGACTMTPQPSTKLSCCTHHSAFLDANDDSALQVIQERHRVQNAWADVGYHYMVGKTGNVYEGRPLNVRGAHITGYNTGSLGICLLGNFMLERPTTAQLRSTEALVLWAKHHLQLTHIATHRQFERITECPGDNLQRYLDALAETTQLTIGIEGYVPPDEAQSSCVCCACDT